MNILISSFSDLYNGTCTWNKKGAIVVEGFRFIDWNKPIFLIKNDTEIEICMCCIPGFHLLFLFR
uniref:Nicastrin small lobe domain-containing protein n=1 Tax=Parascaris equorum TaxID=6256 RepID=A0A914RCC8_PAREQ